MRALEIARDPLEQRPRERQEVAAGARAAAAAGSGTPRAGGRDPRGTVPSSIIARRSRLVAAIQRTSTSSVRLPPTRSNRRSWSTRSSLAWSSGLSSPTSSRKNVPPSASSSRPRLRSVAPVNAPFSWPNSSLSSRVSRQRRAVDRHERLGRARALRVDRARGDLLAGAALAEQQHGRRGPRDLVDRARRPAVIAGSP